VSFDLKKFDQALGGAVAVKNRSGQPRQRSAAEIPIKIEDADLYGKVTFLKVARSAA
jgi:hypothetical protein